MERQELAQLVNSAASSSSPERGQDALHDESEAAYDFELDDLYFLYSLARCTSCVSVLEFGSGWSTLVLAHALLENAESFGDEHRQLVRHPNPFKVMTVDASSHWQRIALGRLPSRLRDFVIPVVSEVAMDTRLGALAHLYSELPNFVPDLVYLDGPDPEQVLGSHNGFNFEEIHSLPNGADLLYLEPQLWPGTYVVIDGRTSNARFLASRFSRSWQTIHDPFGDRTVFRLEETPLGPVGEAHMSIRLDAARRLLQKEGPVLG